LGALFREGAFDKKNKLHSYRIDSVELKVPAGNLAVGQSYKRKAMATTTAGKVTLRQLLSAVNLGDVSVVTEKDGNGVLPKMGSESLVRQTTWIRQRRFEVIRYTVDTLILDLLLKGTSGKGVFL